MPESSYVAAFVAEVRAIHRTGSATAETAFYPALDRLFNAVGEKLKPKALFVTQLKNQGAGMPDGGFFAQTKRSASNAAPERARDPEYGAVEIKPASWNLDTLERSDQTARYLKQYGAVLLTNLREFRLVSLEDGAVRRRETYVLAATEDDFWYRAVDAKHEGLLGDFLRRVMHARVALTEPKQVAWLLASYAREARARAEAHELPAFRNVKKALEESLGIEFEGVKGEHFFRSTLVQTLFYGMFSAWVLWRHSPMYKVPHPRFDWRLAEDFLKVPVLRKLFREVSDRHYLNTIQLTEILDWAGEALNRVRPQLFDIFQGEAAVAYFYEPFLEAFDPQLRKELGVWYTPREIVRYQVERVDHLLRTELGQELGLASDAVRILDPCCGTGAYLTAVLERIHKTLQEEAGYDQAPVAAKLRRAALERVFGFEIMPAPFVIAHMEMARLLEDAGAPLGDEQRAGIYLTNALTGWVPEKHPQSVIFDELEREREAADGIKQHGTILVILGNPPYNGYAGIAKIEEERGLTTAYRAAVAGLPAPQGQGLNDLYIRFFRIAERRIASNRDGQGIVSFISNNAWLDGLSHTTMRHHYLQTFQRIYIDNLNGDKYRTGKTTPEGKPDPSAFSTAQNREGIQVGTAIATLVRNTDQPTSSPMIRDIWGAGKLSYLERDAKREGEPVYTELTPVAALGNPLAYRVHSTAYTGWARLVELLPFSSTGVTSSRDSLVIDFDKDVLEKRIQLYLNNKFSNEDLIELLPSAMKVSARFDPIDVRNELLEGGFKPWQILRYCYRAFDMRWIYWQPTTKLLDEKRRDFVSTMTPKNFWLEARQKGIDDNFCRGTLSSSLCDSFGNGPSNFFPQKVFTQANLYDDQTSQVLNLSEAAERYVNAISAEASDVFQHIVAINHTPAYRIENSGALRSDWPRIPLPATGALLAESAGLGRRLAELLDAESAVKLRGPWTFLAARQHASGRAEAERLRVTVKWGSRGQGSTVMPGRGKAVERAWTKQERGWLEKLAVSQGMTLEEALALLGEGCVDVYLNGGSWWAGVPEAVWRYTLGGYQVLKKWLSYREEGLLGRGLRDEEAAYFAEVVRRIAAIVLMGPGLDASYRAMLPGATGLVGRNADSLRE